MEISKALDPDDMRLKRERMVMEQIVRRGVSDSRVLAAIRKVPRHWFVPQEYRDEAYDDIPLPIGYEQTISQPYIVAYMTEILRLSENDRVLEIGTGSGYQTAVLAALARDVYSVEIVKPLAMEAQKQFQALGLRNIHCRIGNGWSGWLEEAPFDQVIVTAAAYEIPNALVEQLQEGGRMVIPVGRQTQELIEGEKKHGILQKTRKIPVRFVPLINPEKEDKSSEA